MAGLYQDYTGYLPNAIPTMTSNTAPSGVASASSEASATYSPWKAMDKSTAAQWRTTTTGKYPAWLQYELASSKTIKRYTITSHTTIDRAPKTWTFEGFNGSTWDVLDTQTNIVFSASEKKTFDFTNSTAYTKYRVNISLNNGGILTEIAELEMMEADPQVTNIQVAGLNLQTELEVTNVQVAGITLQVEWDVPDGKLKYWDGSEWVLKPLKWYNNDWLDKSTVLKWYDPIAGVWK